MMKLIYLAIVALLLVACTPEAAGPAKEENEDKQTDPVVTDEMLEQQQKEKAQQKIFALDMYCGKKCTDAKTLKDKVDFCKSYFEEEFDVNQNMFVDYTDAIDIFGYCEDRIYCAAYRPCASLNMKNCKKLVCDYYSSELGITDDVEKADKLVGYNYGNYEGWYQPGDCYYDLSDKEKEDHWFTYFMMIPDINDFNEMGDHLGGKCFFKKGTCYSTYTQISDKFDTVYTWEEWAEACPITP